MTPLPPKVAAWVAIGRTQNAHGGVSDNSAAWQRVLRVDSVRRGIAAALAEEAEINWAGSIVCAVSEAQDGNISGISPRDARKFFPDGWQFPTLTDEEKAIATAAEKIRAAENAIRAAEYAAKLAEPKNSEVTEPHTKYDNNPGNGVW